MLMEMKTPHCQGAGVHGGDSMACSGRRVLHGLVPKAWILNRAPGLRTLTKGMRRQDLRSYGSLGGKECHAQDEEGDGGLHSHTHKRGECVRALSSPLLFPILAP